MAKLRRTDDLESGSSPFQLNNVAVLNVVYNGFRVFVMHLSMFSPGGGGGGGWAYPGALKGAAIGSFLSPILLIHIIKN